MASAAAVLLLGAAAYGYVFGLWRHPVQAIYSALKMPVLLFSVIGVTTLVNAMLAQTLGARLTLRQVFLSQLLAMAIAAAILGALSPVAALLILQTPRPASAAPVLSADPACGTLTRAYGNVLLSHVALIGACGTAGLLRLARLMYALTGSRAQTWRLMIAWFAVCGFVGCELAWLFSPFLCKPSQPPHVIAREYFEQNFYERVWEIGKVRSAPPMPSPHRSKPCPPSDGGGRRRSAGFR
jgi:hypothetical protein